MNTTSHYQQSFDKLIHVINSSEDVSFFNYSVNEHWHVAIIDVMHVGLETAVEVIVAAFNRMAIDSKAIVEQIYHIVKEVRDSHRSRIDGFVKSVKTDLVSAALISSPYREEGLDIRIAIADSEAHLLAAKDFIHYELGINALKGFKPVTIGGLSCQESR